MSVKQRGRAVCSIKNDEMVGARCFGCCQAHRDLLVGFLLLWYSVLCNDESLSFLYLLFYIDLYVLEDNAWTS